MRKFCFIDSIYSLNNNLILHPKNIHNSSYNFKELIKANPSLKEFVFVNQYGTETIDFSNPKAVFNLNKALLAHYHNVENWTIPEGYLCPPIPSRADYLYYMKDVLEKNNSNKQQKTIKGLDIGVGANCIYPILASQLFDWKMVGTDSNQIAVEVAKKNIQNPTKLKENIEIRHQDSNANLFKGIIQENEYFDFTMCNPPFYSSEKEALTQTVQKLKNLKKDNPTKSVDIKLNFGGQANELWCNGGETLFIKRMIKQSIEFKKQVGYFTTLVSKSEHLKPIYKLLEKYKANYTTIAMEHGNKKTRIVVWYFSD